MKEANFEQEKASTIIQCWQILHGMKPPGAFFQRVRVDLAAIGAPNQLSVRQVLVEHDTLGDSFLASVPSFHKPGLYIMLCTKVVCIFIMFFPHLTQK